jgi:hypothetical protein
MSEPNKKPKLEAPASPVSSTMMAERKPHPSGEGNPKYKIEYCSRFQRSGSCRSGDQCKFAHGFADLRSLVYEHSHESPLKWDMPKDFRLLQELVKKLFMVSAAPLDAEDDDDDDDDAHEAVRAFGPDALKDAVTALLQTNKDMNLHSAVVAVMEDSSAPTPDELQPFVAALSKVAIVMRNGPPGWKVRYASAEAFQLQVQAIKYAENLYDETSKLVAGCARSDSAKFGAFVQLLQATKRRPLLDDEVWNDEKRINMSMVDAFYKPPETD